MMDEAAPICSTDFQPVGRSGILPVKAGKKRARCPLAHDQDGCAARKGWPELAPSRGIAYNKFTRTAQA
jgi:hypothetical protein